MDCDLNCIGTTSNITKTTVEFYSLPSRIQIMLYFIVHKTQIQLSQVNLGQRLRFSFLNNLLYDLDVFEIGYILVSHRYVLHLSSVSFGCWIWLKTSYLLKRT